MPQTSHKNLEFQFPKQMPEGHWPKFLAPRGTADPGSQPKWGAGMKLQLLWGHAMNKLTFKGTWYLKVNDVEQHHETQWSKMGTSPIEMGEIDGHAGHVEYIYIYTHIYLRASLTSKRKNKKRWRHCSGSQMWGTNDGLLLQWHASYNTLPPAKSEPSIELMITFNTQLICYSLLRADNMVSGSMNPFTPVWLYWCW